MELENYKLILIYKRFENQTRPVQSCMHNFSSVRLYIIAMKSQVLLIITTVISHSVTNEEISGLEGSL